MITQRRVDARELNARARGRLDARGRLGPERIELPGGEFAAGDLVVLKRNDPRFEVENGNRGRLVVVDGDARTVSVEMSGDRTVKLPRSYLERRTAGGEPALVHGYAGTAHVAQGSTTDRAFILGSDAAYREWGYVAWSRARLQSRFYICEPDAVDEHHATTGGDRNSVDDVVRAMERSRGQRAALDVGAAHVVRRDPPAHIVGALGERPAQPARAAVWDRAAQLVERYRTAHGVEDTASALGPSPGDLLGRVAWRRASRGLDKACRELDDPRTVRSAARDSGRSL